MTAFPKRIVRSIRPTNHASGREKAEKRHNYHAKGRSTDVWDGIQRELTTQSSRAVSPEFGNESVRRFVARS